MAPTPVDAGFDYQDRWRLLPAVGGDPVGRRIPRRHRLRHAVASAPHATWRRWWSGALGRASTPSSSTTSIRGRGSTTRAATHPSCRSTRRMRSTTPSCSTDHAHAQHLAVGQKNTPQLGRRNSLDVVGFDFAIAEQCGQYDECDRYRSVFGNRMIDIEYGRSGFRAACAAVGRTVSVVLRDRLVSTPGSPGYVNDRC
ncbi:MAG: endo alpha-1,4 polygalactosaminidase [Ilumatobacteraceae bacterium]